MKRVAYLGLHRHRQFSPWPVSVISLGQITLSIRIPGVLRTSGPKMQRWLEGGKLELGCILLFEESSNYLTTCELARHGIGGCHLQETLSILSKDSELSDY